MRSVTARPPLQDRYALAEAIGHGVDASLYRARDLQTGDIVAVKRYDHRVRQDIDFVVNFRRNARQARALRHPHVLRMLAYGYADEGYYTVSPYLDWGDLSRYIPARVPSRGAEVSREGLEILTQACLGLGYIHQVGLLHRNLKPSNILLCADGSAVVADMAMSRERVDALASPDPDMSPVSYASPEQRAGGELSPTSDIYAIGVMLYQVCTGRAPFAPPAGQRLDAEPPSPRSLNPRIDPTLEAVIMRCLAREPERRYTAASDLAAALAECQAVLGRGGAETSVRVRVAARTTRGRLRVSALHTLIHRAHRPVVTDNRKSTA